MSSNPCPSCVHRIPNPDLEGLPVPGFTCQQNLPYFQAWLALDEVSRPRRLAIAPFMPSCPHFSSAGAQQKNITLPQRAWSQLKTENPTEWALDRLAEAIVTAEQSPPST